MPGRTELLGSTQPDPETVLVHAEAGVFIGQRPPDRARLAWRNWHRQSFGRTVTPGPTAMVSGADRLNRPLRSNIPVDVNYSARSPGVDVRS